MWGRRRTSLILVMVVALILGVGTQAQAATTRGCVVTLALNAQGAFDEPFSRWMGEACAMFRLTAYRAQRADGTVMTLALKMGEAHALDMTLTGEGNVWTLSGSLVDAPMTLADQRDWVDMLMDAMDVLDGMPSGGRVYVLSGDGLARAMKNAAIRLRAWAAAARATSTRDCEACGACEVCARIDLTAATAQFIDSMAEPFDGLTDQNVATVTVAPFDVTLAPDVDRESVPAPDDIDMRLIKRALIATAHAIAASDGSQIAPE